MGAGGGPPTGGWQIHPPTSALLVEPADTYASGAYVRKDVEVQILWRAPSRQKPAGVIS